MTKSELKNSLGRIQPRETLVNETIVQMRAYKTNRSRRFSWANPSQGFRLAGAICALALVFWFGFAVAKQPLNPPTERTLADLTVVAANTDEATTPIFGSEYANGYITIKGDISSLSFMELTETDITDKAIHRCKIVIHANGLIEKSNELAVDLNRTSETFEAEVVFYDEGTMNAFFNQSTQEMLLCLSPDASGNWNIIAFAPVEK